jgi:hypothetical protein
MQDFEGMAVGVLKVEGADAGSILVPVRQPLRSGGGVLNVVLPQNLVGAIDVADDDRDVLEPAIVALRVGFAFGRQVLGQFNRLTAEPHPHHPHAQPEEAFQVLVTVAPYFNVGSLLERKDARIEVHGAVHVRNRHAHGIDRRGQGLIGRLGGNRHKVGGSQDKEAAKKNAANRYRVCETLGCHGVRTPANRREQAGAP